MWAKQNSCKGAEKLCRERGALLMIDEIQTGFGRTGKWFGHQHFDLAPDIICMAKGIGGGFPMGAIAYNDRVNAALYQGAHGSTFGGNPMACAAGLARLKFIRMKRSSNMPPPWVNCSLNDSMPPCSIA